MSIGTDTDTSRVQAWLLLLRAWFADAREFLEFCWLEAQRRVAVHGSWGAYKRTVFGSDTRAQAGGGGLVNLVIGVMIAGIVVFQVFIPVIQDATSNLSGTEAIIAGLLPLFAVLLVLISLASPLMQRT